MSIQADDVGAGSPLGNHQKFTPFGGALYFIAGTSSFGAEIYKITEAGSLLRVSDFQTGGPKELEVFNGELYVSAVSSSYGDELFKITAGGSLVLAEDINPLRTLDGSGEYTEFLGAHYFSATTPEHGHELYRILSEGSVERVADMIPGPESSRAGSFTEYNGELYFRAIAPSVGEELFKITASGSIELVMDFTPGEGFSLPGFFTHFNGELYLVATGSSSVGRELYKVTTEGSVVLLELTPGPNSSQPFGFVEFNDELYISADGGSGVGWELFKVTALGSVVRAADINQGAESSFPGAFSGFTDFNDELYFTADGGSGVGNELFKVTATGSVTLAAEINPNGNAFSNVNLVRMIEFNGELYFNANNGSSGAELFKLTGGGSVVLVEDLVPGGFSSSSFPSEFTIFNDELYFVATNGSAGRELHKVQAGGSVVLVEDLDPGGFGSNPADLQVLGEALYFSTQTTSFSREFYRVTTDGSVEGVEDVSGRSLLVRQPVQFVEFNGEHYFAASVGGLGRELFKITADGSAVLVADIRPGFFGSNPSDLAVINDELYFTAWESLYKLTAGGSVVFVNVADGAPLSSVPDNFTYFGAPIIDLDVNDDNSVVASKDFTAPGGFVETVDGTLGTGPVAVVDLDVAIEAERNAELVSATTTLTNPLDGADEGLSIDAVALAAIAGGAISLDGTSTATMLILTGAASAADYEAALKLVRYDNASNDPTEVDRIVEVTVSDGNHGASNTAVATIAVTAMDHSPNLLMDLDGEMGFTIVGIDGLGGRFGARAGNGDFNGDGFDDLLLGDVAANEAYVLFGSASPFDPLVSLSDLDGSNGFRIPRLEFGDDMWGLGEFAGGL